jgi:3',5'-cyclic AMP phosphodiesterase CpdA
MKAGSLMRSNKFLFYAVLTAAAALLITACSTVSFRAETSTAAFPAYPETSFAVFSDPHVFLPELGIGQPAFEKIKFSDRKIFEHSTSLLDAAIGKIIEAKPRFVLIPGDLSKDGEEAVHIAVAAALGKLESAGIPVFVIPGNHDVNNPNAEKYEGRTTEHIPNVTPRRFAEIYKDFGYNAAIERDPDSLAYIVEPEQGLWLLAMDACRYDLSPKQKREHTGGALTAGRLAWVKKILLRARMENKAVLAMMHHGVVPHFEGQKKQFPQYVVEDNDPLSRMLAEYGVRVVFTGHFHAQSIAGSWWDARDRKTAPPSPRFIFDIETGSLVTYPCPYRLVQLRSGQVMRVRSFRIDSIPEMTTGFSDYAREYSRKGTVPYIESVLAGYGISKREAQAIAEPLTDAGIAHFAGDAQFRGTEMYPTSNLSLMGSIAIAMKKDVIEGMWKGVLPHADNNVDINLADGTFSEETLSGSPSF